MSAAARTWRALCRAQTAHAHNAPFSTPPHLEVFRLESRDVRRRERERRDGDREKAATPRHGDATIGVGLREGEGAARRPRGVRSSRAAPGPTPRRPPRPPPTPPRAPDAPTHPASARPRRQGTRAPARCQQTFAASVAAMASIAGVLEKMKSADQVRGGGGGNGGGRGGGGAAMPETAPTRAPAARPRLPTPRCPHQDFRYMALSDLATELARDDFALDDGAQAPLAAGVVERLADASADVRAQAVKW